MNTEEELEKIGATFHVDGCKNYKEIFMGHAHMFTMNPDKFKAIFDKYDHSDLVRCLEKNGAVIEKL